MTDDGTPAGAQGPADPGSPDPPPISPGGPWQTGTRVEQLVTWIQAIRPGFTDSALERSAIAGGFTAEEVREALALADSRQRQDEAIAPVRSTAKRIVLGAYGLVWILFAIPYLLRPSPTMYGLGAFAQGILTIALLLGLLFSTLIMRRVHPDPARSGRALTLLLVAPVIVLLGISGLCLPFVGTSG
jgi:hypothetical protein